MNIYSRRLICACCVAVALLLSGCGWQLQGAHRVPEYVEPLYLELVDQHSDFAEALTRRLQLSGVNVTADRNLAQTVLNVTLDSTGQHVASVSALNEPQQYEVYYNVDYRLDRKGAQSSNLLPAQSIDLSRTMTYDKTLALAKQREQLALRATLAEEIADQIMRRLSLLPRNEPAVNDDGLKSTK